MHEVWQIVLEETDRVGKVRLQAADTYLLQISEPCKPVRTAKSHVAKKVSRLNNNNNNNSHDNVYGAVIVAVHCHCESSPGSSDECSTQRQVAANLWTKPISLSQ